MTLSKKELKQIKKVMQKEKRNTEFNIVFILQLLSIYVIGMITGAILSAVWSA
jgi:hypothetical protein